MNEQRLEKLLLILTILAPFHSACKALELFPKETLDQLSQYHSPKITICNFVK